MAFSPAKEAAFWMKYVELCKTLSSMCETLDECDEPERKKKFLELVNSAVVQASGEHLGSDDIC